jgi:multidrug efflux pump subunit AcrA (membrane-fusion protein)
MNPNRRARRWVIGAIVLGAVAIAAALWLAWPSLLQAEAVPVVVVESGSFVRRVRAEGHLQAAQATLLGPPADLRISLKIAWLAPDGSPVREGDVVIRFDPTDHEKALEDGKNDRATAEARLQRTSLNESVAKRNLERDVALASRELEHANVFTRRDPEIFSRVEIIESGIDGELAQERHDNAEHNLSTRDGLTAAELELLAIERRKADLKILQAERSLASLEVRAPHDGVFVLKSEWGRQPEVGKTVWGGHALAELPRLDAMQAKVFVLEADAGGLSLGQAVVVRVDSQPSVLHAGRIAQVDTLAQPRDHRAPVQYFAALIDLDHTDPAVMKPGQRVEATITIDELADAISVPRQSVFQRDGKSFVYRQREGEFEAAEVTLGPAALGRVVVTGLEAGDRIALWDPARGPLADPDAPEADRSAPKVGPVAVSERGGGRGPR